MSYTISGVTTSTYKTTNAINNCI